MKKSVALLLWIASGVVLAAMVSAADIATAIQNSPSASTWLKQNAQAVAQLAINVESGGNTTAFNGSCCYGVLQMNRTNIARYANVTPEQYQQLSLQEQVNAWTQLTSKAMQSAAVTNLLALGTFDGRTVDGNLVLACVQLGIGNCQTMINSGKCSGFADRNGTTICSMADKIAGTNTGGSSGGNTGGSGAGAGGSMDTPGRASVSMAEAFAQGSGMEMSVLKRNLQIIGISAVALILAAGLGGMWQMFSMGRMSTADLKLRTIQACILLSIAVAMISWL
ncbi:DUF3262 family protein [Comamonas sp. CMM01]|uniref:DUF3262 family protein n=1 Tax=Comamonas sp. CMM01 TaxID=2769280 RepID=UPI0017808274|nr:DUF3262 family protein [Comamonas sp. CMM01]MBD9534202.1 DUF3262 family protein [Comamonas sp. CMM01]